MSATTGTGRSETDTAGAGDEKAGGDEELTWKADARQAAATAAISVGSMARRLPQLVVRAFRLGWQIDPRSVTVLLVCQAASALLGAAGLYASTGTIGSLFGPGRMDQRLAAALPSILVIASSLGLRRLLGITIQAITVRLSPRIARAAEATVLRATIATELAAYDTAGYSDELEAADRGAESCSAILGQAQNLLSSLGSLVGAAGVLTVLHPVLLPLLAAAALPQGIASVRAARVAYLADREALGDRRILANLRWYIHLKRHADQVRSDTMGGFLMDKYDTAGRRLDAATRSSSARAARVSVLGALASGLGTAAVWLVTLWLVESGRMSLPRGSAAVLALTAVSNALAGLVGYGAELSRTGMYLDDWAQFLDTAGGHALARGTGSPAAPELITVRSLSYRYPNTERTALDSVDLTLRRGEIVALVGENGSGKTTLAKVLAGLYLPAAGDGAVEWDGTDTRELDPQALWRQVAVVPQDYARWMLTARENITLGQPTGEGDRAVWRAARSAGADEVIDELRSGLATLLAVEWMGGEELSGGQWQRMAIARSFHRPAGLLILDEPTAALDIYSSRSLQGTRAIRSSDHVPLQYLRGHRYVGYVYDHDWEVQGRASHIACGRVRCVGRGGQLVRPAHRGVVVPRRSPGRRSLLEHRAGVRGPGGAVPILVRRARGGLVEGRAA
ncbi:ATP-binding cassette domain-containing protein [Streptomyces tateyamensis]|uniref:ATP-binding cassette domain-containing protein n=1 Tax=Streptomyces tateyamensis TaxID=565073 RepID=UPI0011B47770|nr:ABC transporter ATP-binding protein [Streptomyces tateyamensis]